MEAPEKFYTDENGNNPLLKRHCDSDIEYVRKDAFIEKALRWMMNTGGVNYMLSGEMIEDFKNYMKGEL